MLRQFHLQTHRENFYNITAKAAYTVQQSRISDGICIVFCPHTTAGITINENADPDVRTDMESIFNHLIKEREPYYEHTLEGWDDMPAHAKATIIGVSLTIPITEGRLNMGIWQGIYLWEHRRSKHRRKLVVTIVA